MAVQFEESRRYLDNETLYILLGAMAVTDAFVLIAYALGWIKEWWEPAALVALTAFGAIFAFMFRFTLKVEDGNITVGYFKKRVYKQKRILDAKKGDIDVLRDYSGWGRGNRVVYRTYAQPGIDSAVSIKLGGREVVTVTTERADEFFDLVYSLRRQD